MSTYKERGIALRRYKDDHTHILWKAFRLHRNQAKHRNEGYDLSFDEFCEFWNTDERYKMKGNGPGTVNMKRILTQLPWAKDNICARQKV